MDNFELLKESVIQYDAKGAAKWAQAIIEEGADPLEGLDTISEAMRIVGDGYARNELWLPDLVGAAEAAQSALPILEAELRRTGKQAKRKGTVVIGTVFGDIHTIGKSMVSVLLVARGFRVIDVGTNVPAERFVEAVEDNNADILAMSSLLTTTAPQQGKVIRMLDEAGTRDKVKVMVGGGAITAEFAENIGADGYKPTAAEAVELAEALIKG